MKRSMLDHFVLICCASAIYGLSHPALAAGQGASGKEPPDFSKVEALIQTKIATGVPSISLAVTQHGKIIWESAFGNANIERAIPATVNTPYYLASVSKTITATALMELVDSGKISLNKPVNDYLSGAKLSSPLWDPSGATVLRMATHSAGLATYDEGCEKVDPHCSTDVDDLIRRYGVIVWKPGDHFDYSNADYGILGQVIADTSKHSLAQFLQQRVFEPLGMNNCFLDSNLQRLNNAAARYDQEHLNKETPRSQSTTPGASAIYCSVHDLALFGMFQLADHLGTQTSILPDRSLRWMQKPLISAGDGLEYGLGWWVQPDKHGYYGVLAQGGTLDSTAYLQLIPSEDIAVAMLWNSGAPDGDMVIDEVLSALLPSYRKNLALAQPHPGDVPSSSSTALMRDILGRWSGTIYAYNGSMPLVLSINQDGTGWARLGSKHEVSIAHFESEKGMLKWRMAGPAGFGDTGATPYLMDIKLYLHGSTLMGAARTSPAPPSGSGALLFYAVVLHKT
jgi:CubicO group peptidase (beta-lactamase class C family)